MTELDSVVKQSLLEFADDVFRTNWFGKEREAVSLYAFGYLLKQCRPASVLYDPRQIGIEVRVQRPPTKGTKAEVCKDLVIWPEPSMTRWFPSGNGANTPIAVLEWKADVQQLAANDIAWLRTFTGHNPGETGYAVSLDLKARQFRLLCARVRADEIDEQWLAL